MSEKHSAGFFCDLNAFTHNERAEHAALTKAIFMINSRKVTWLSDLLLIECTKEKHSFEELSRWAIGEAKCCPFLRFEIIIPPNDENISLKVTGAEGAIDFLKTEISGFWKSCEC